MKRQKVLDTILTIIAVALAVGMVAITIALIAFAIWFCGEGAREMKEAIIAKALELAGGFA